VDPKSLSPNAADVQINQVDITFENAKRFLIDESLVRPVLVDFWADWCGPCKSLAPILNKLAVEYKGAFLLAKVNADELQQIAGQFGIQSLPTLVLMRNGQPVDMLQGAQPEAVIKAMLAKHLPAPWQAAVSEASVRLAGGQLAEGIALLRGAYQESGKEPKLALAFAAGLIQCHRLEEAGDILKTIKMVDQDAEYKQLMARLELAKNAAKAPEIAELEERHRANPNDLTIVQALAVQYSQHQHNEEALELLWSVLQTNLNARDGELKRIYMDVIAAVGKGDPLAARYQRKLYALLY
jgi:putative thioredoxin